MARVKVRNVFLTGPCSRLSCPFFSVSSLPFPLFSTVSLSVLAPTFNFFYFLLHALLFSISFLIHSCLSSLSLLSIFPPRRSDKWKVLDTFEGDGVNGRAVLGCVTLSRRELQRK